MALLGKIFKVLVAVVVAALLAKFVYDNFVSPAFFAESLDVDIVGVSLEGIGIGTARVRVVLDLHNPGDMPVTLNRLEYDLYINGDYVGHGWTTQRVEIVPHSHAALETVIDVDLGDAAAAALDALIRGSYTVTARGHMYIDLPGTSLELPFTVSKTLS